jgi:3-deoxy-D-manno-octulosonic-acid transferase
MGPYTHNFRAIVAALQARQAILIASPAELPQGLARLLADREFARQLGASAKSVFEEQAGATARSISLLLEAAQ